MVAEIGPSDEATSALDLLYGRGAGPDPGSWPKQTVTMSSKTRSKLNRMTKSVGERQL